MVAQIERLRVHWRVTRCPTPRNQIVVLAGVLAATTASRLPDLVIGIIVAVIVIRGGIHILQDARNENAMSSCCSSA